jgi:hypothetical protein
MMNSFFANNIFPLFGGWRAIAGAWRILFASGPPKKLLPGTTQRPLNTHDGSVEDVHFSGFNFLNGAGMQPHHFSQSFLREILLHPHSAHIAAESLQLLRLMSL